MKLAFCLFNYFPYGGVQRDMMRIASACLLHGHRIDIYTMSWAGELPANMNVNIVTINALTNHGRAAAFSKKIAALSRDQYDTVVGFNKMAGLDFCFVGDVCLKTKMAKRFFCRFLPRYRVYLQLEAAVFSADVPTRVMLLTPQQQEEYSQTYPISLDRIVLLPPGLKYQKPSEKTKVTQEITLLFVATKFFNKGLDRAIKALASLHQQHVKLKVIGGDDPTFFQKLIQQYHLETQVEFLGTRDDLFDLMCDADILIHPARVEAAGMVLLEAVIAGLPILTTENCGYAFHVKRAEAGIVLSMPFDQSVFNHALNEMLDKNKRLRWHRNGVDYAKIANLYEMGEEAVRWIEG